MSNLSASLSICVEWGHAKACPYTAQVLKLALQFDIVRALLRGFLELPEFFFEIHQQG